MKKIVTLLSAVLLFAAVAVLAVFADATGEMYYIYTNPTTGSSSVIVNNSWEYVESNKTLYIRSLTSGYNECGRTSYSSDGAWEAYKDSIEHVVLVGSFTKITGTAFKNYTALKTVTIASNTQQYDSECFYGCTNLESITVRGNHHLIGYADLGTCVSISGQKHFAGTEITKINIGKSGTLVNTETIDHFNEGSTILAYAENPMYTLLDETGLFTVVDNTPVKVNIVFDGKTYEETYGYEEFSAFQTIEGVAVLVFSDPEYQNIYDGSSYSAGDTYYARPVLSSLGYMVRVEDHQGLRSLFEFDCSALDGVSGYTLKEFGCIAKLSTELYEELYYEMDDIYSVKVYSDGAYTGNVLSVHNDAVRFAYTAVGYEKDGALSVANAEQDLLFRGYVMFSDEIGNYYISYTDILEQDLVTACEKTLDVVESSGGTLLSEDEKAFVSASLDAGAMPNYIYTKEELIEMLTTVYNDKDHYIPAQHLGVGRNALSDYLEIVKDASGAQTAMVSFDFESMTDYTKGNKILVETAKEYIERGGIVSFSYHMENPTGNYTDKGLCRGELGAEDKWDELLTSGTDLNDNFNTILDKAARILKDFDDEGYPILWRPLHEMNGDWFWWCAIQGWSDDSEVVISQEMFKALWIYIYEYFTETWGLKNLVWVYSPSPSTALTVSTFETLPVMYCYPGDEYCDIVGGDWYVARDTSVTDDVTYKYNIDVAYEQLLETGKPVALTEFGPGSSLKADAAAGEKQEDYFSCRDQLEIVKKMQSEGLYLTYVLNWSGWISMHEIGYMDELMQDESALDLGEMKTMFDLLYKKR